MRRHFLFVLWAGGGNVPPQLVLAGKLAGRGHSVRVLAPVALREAIEQAGLTYRPYSRAPEHDEADPQQSIIRDFEARTPIGAGTAARDRLIAGTADAIAADTLDEIARHATDVVALDYLLVGAAFAAEKAGIPAVPLVHHAYPFPSTGAPPFGTGWSPARGPLGRVRDAVGYAAFERMMSRPLLSPLNATRRRLGLAPLRDGVDAFTQTARVLVLTSAAFEFPAARPASVRYVGPQLKDESSAPPWDAGKNNDVPLVVVSLSTTFQGQAGLLTRAVNALGELPVRALVAAGPVSLPAAALPDNVEVHAYIPHERVMRQADAVVTHAGHGTVMSALAHGVPLVCLPIGRDQPDVAARVVRAGAGVRLRKGSSPARIRSAVKSVLDDPRYRDAAKRLQRAILDEIAEDKAVAELEALASARRPASDSHTTSR